MFALGIRYLCGWAMATHPANRQRAEWPPHPDRIFMALVAAHFETEADPKQRKALEWLESLGNPALSASPASYRSIVTSYVPVNDVEMPRLPAQKSPTSGQLAAGLSLLPNQRSRRPRHFPVAVPDSDVAYVIWPEADPKPEYRRALERLCRNVTYLGHSASLVHVWVEDHPPEASLVPVRGVARHRLRVSGRGRLANLEAQFQAGFRPTTSLWSGYDRPPRPSATATTARSVFDDELIVLRKLRGRTLPLETTLQLSEALRGAIMHACPDPPPEWISSHKPDGSRTEEPHLAMFPLPHVGREHADGHLLGIALAIPRQIAVSERGSLLRDFLFDEFGEPLPRQLTMGKAGDWTVALDERDDRPVALDPRTWTAAAQRWATVTPIVLDRHPKGEGDSEETVQMACERIGLPRPLDVILTPVSLFLGAPHARSFPPLPAKFGKPSRLHTHAVITFPEKVLGPVLLGAGRYRGYGLCRPWRSGGGDGS